MSLRRSVGELSAESTLVEMKEKEDKRSSCHCALCMQQGEMKCERDCQECVNAIHKGVKRQENPSSDGQNWSEVEKSYCKCEDCSKRVARGEERCKKSCKYCQETIHREQRWAGRCPPDCLQCKKIEATCCYCERCEQMEVKGGKRCSTDCRECRDIIHSRQQRQKRCPPNCKQCEELKTTYCDCKSCRKRKDQHKRRCIRGCKNCKNCLHGEKRLKGLCPPNCEQCREIEVAYCHCEMCKQREAEGESRCKTDCEHCKDEVHRNERMKGQCPQDCKQCEDEMKRYCSCEACSRREEEEGKARCKADCDHCKHEKKKRNGECLRDCKQCEKERADQNAEREKRIKEPWQYETQKPMAEPPDISYRNAIIRDQKRIDRLFENQDLHFTERCLRYQSQDVWVELLILEDYPAWANSMLEDAQKKEDQTRTNFFQELYRNIVEDKREVYDEYRLLVGAEKERERQQVSNLLGVPPNQQEWSSEDWKRFLEYGANVYGWGGLKEAKSELERRRAAEEMSIPFNQEDWSTEDWKRYSESDETVEGWGSPQKAECEFKLRQLGKKLNLPRKQEDWNPQHWQQYVDYGEWATGWVDICNAKNKLERRRVAGKLGIPPKKEEWTTEDKEKFSEYEQQHNIYLRGWSGCVWQREVERRRASQELGIPNNQEEWTTADWQRFSQQGRPVKGWGCPTAAKAEVKRRQLCEELGIPFDREKWTTEDKQKFDEYKQQEYRYVEGWSCRCELKRWQAGKELGIPYESDEWTTEDKSKYFSSGKKPICCWPSPPTPPGSEKGDSSELKRNEEAPKTTKDGAENKQSKDAINISAIDKDDSEPAPALETEPSVLKVRFKVDEAQQASPSGAVAQPKESDDNNNSERPTESETKQLISVLSLQVPPSKINDNGISPTQAFALLLVALVLYELMRQNLRL